MNPKYESVVALPLLPRLNMIEVVTPHHGASFLEL
jgi:hypothetical protein